ncbi:YidC/Oxa1 family membrane protein insertase [Chloroflexota bacterium]
MEWIGQGWDLIILNPLVNILIIMSGYLFGSFGLSIIVLTIAVNILMYPLTQKQIKSQKAMQAMQGEIAEIRKKYAKDKQRASQEQMRLMKESGVSTTGCLVPMLVQMPVFIALYQSIIRLLATAPEGFLNLSQRLYYSWPEVFSSVPLQSHFLWLDLAVPDMILAVLVGASMWIQQKMTTPATTDPQQKAQGQMMLWMMPLMFGFISISFPSGLALYWFTSTAIRVILQYYTSGLGGLSFTSGTDTVKPKGDSKIQGSITRKKKSLDVSDISADIVIEPSSAREEGIDNGESGDNRKDSRRSDSTSLRATRRQSGGSGSQRRKRR